MNPTSRFPYNKKPVSGLTTEEKVLQDDCSFKPTVSAFAQSLPIVEKDVLQRLTAEEPHRHRIPQGSMKQECTFHPSIHPGPPSMREGKVKYVVVSNHLPKREPPSKLHPRHALTECTFHPAIRVGNSKSSERINGCFIRLHPTCNKVKRPEPDLPLEHDLPLYSTEENASIDDVSSIDMGFVDVPSEGLWWRNT